MTRSRSIVSSTTYLITRRCTRREFWVRPGSFLNQLVCYALAYAATLYGLEAHAVCVMSNHYHLIVTDPGGRLPEFEEWLNRTLAKAVNLLYARNGVLWEPERSYSAVELEDADSVLEKLVYVLVNPVAAGLVSHGKRWPGVRAAPLEAGTTLGAKRPKLYFNPKGRLPRQSRVDLTKPPGFEDYDDEQFGALLKQKVEEKEAELREEAQLEEREFQGCEEVLRQSPSGSPTTTEERDRLNPRVATRNKWSRVAALKRQQAFLEAYEEARLRFRAGEREVEFPYGTYWMRVHCGVRCHGPPEAA